MIIGPTGPTPHKGDVSWSISARDSDRSMLDVHRWSLHPSGRVRFAGEQSFEGCLNEAPDISMNHVLDINHRLANPRD